jgi:hypothetical protein
MGKRIRTALIASLILPVAVFVTVGTAGAAAKVKPNLTCSVTGTATISPGISTAPADQTLTVTTQLVGCTSDNSSGAGISSDASTTSPGVTSKKPETCSSLGKKSPPTTTSDAPVTWNNTDTSSFTYKTFLNKGGPGMATIAGKVVSGTFDKGKITGTLSYTLTSVMCTVADPVQGATISGTFNIT